jgi:hypothetical protein
MQGEKAWHFGRLMKLLDVAPGLTCLTLPGTRLQLPGPSSAAALPGDGTLSASAIERLDLCCVALSCRLLPSQLRSLVLRTPLLTHLNLRCCEDAVDTDTLELVARTCQGTLRWLDISCCRNVGAAALRTLTSLCSRLTGIDLCYCGADAEFHEAMMQLCAARGAQLTNLGVSGFRLFTDQCFASILSTCTALEVFGFGGCPLLSEAVLDMLMASPSHATIRTLVMHKVKLRPTKVAATISACPRLEALDVNECMPIKVFLKVKDQIQAELVAVERAMYWGIKDKLMEQIK